MWQYLTRLLMISNPAVFCSSANVHLSRPPLIHSRILYLSSRRSFSAVFGSKYGEVISWTHLLSRTLDQSFSRRLYRLVCVFVVIWHYHNQHSQFAPRNPLQEKKMRSYFVFSKVAYILQFLSLFLLQELISFLWFFAPDSFASGSYLRCIFLASQFQVLLVVFVDYIVFASSLVKVSPRHTWFTSYEVYAMD